MAERLWYWSPENNADVVRLYDGVLYVGKWIYSEKAFHYYLSDTDSFGYPKPLPEGCPPPPDLPAPAGNVGDGSFYGRVPSVETDSTPQGTAPMKWTDIFSKKTFWAGLGMVCTAVVAAGAAYAQSGINSIDWTTTINGILLGLAAIFGRQAIMKLEK